MEFIVKPIGEMLFPIIMERALLGHVDADCSFCENFWFREYVRYGTKNGKDQ